MSARVFRSPDEAKGQFGPCALAIGNFDGVHLGHRTLLSETIVYASANGLIPAVLTFDPHPTAVVAPDRTPKAICSLDERLELLAKCGIDHILVLPFTADLSRLSPGEFVWQILVSLLDTRAVFVGNNFRFGNKKAGNCETLRQMGEENGFVCRFLQPVTYRGEVISSSAIREHVASGRVGKAGRLLGRCFSIRGPVVSGHGVGSKQTVPTLNLRPDPAQVLPRGVYVTETRDLDTGARWDSITNSGIRPTFGGDEVTVETFLLSPFEGQTPENISVSFRRFLRPERQFPDPQALRSQIMKDVGQAQAYWRRTLYFHSRPFRYTESR
jgi:riboflavin kinase / FMN adenylyltransferase